MEQIEIILPKQKCLEQALSLRVGVNKTIPETRYLSGFPDPSHRP